MIIYDIRYNGEDITDNIDQLRLKSGSVYKIDHGWDTGMEMNGHWIFYVYDEIGKHTNESFGFELEIKNIETLREYNLGSLLRAS